MTGKVGVLESKKKCIGRNRTFTDGKKEWFCFEKRNTICLCFFFFEMVLQRRWRHLFFTNEKRKSVCSFCFWVTDFLLLLFFGLFQNLASFPSSRLTGVFSRVKLLLNRASSVSEHPLRYFQTCLFRSTRSSFLVLVVSASRRSPCSSCRASSFVTTITDESTRMWEVTVVVFGYGMNK